MYRLYVSACEVFRVKKNFTKRSVALSDRSRRGKTDLESEMRVVVLQPRLAWSQAKWRVRAALAKSRRRKLDTDGSLADCSHSWHITKKILSEDTIRFLKIIFTCSIREIVISETWLSWDQEIGFNILCQLNFVRFMVNTKKPLLPKQKQRKLFSCRLLITQSWLVI